MANPDIYEIDLQDGNAPPLPDYVQDVIDARYIGITTAELREMPMGEIAEYRIVRTAEQQAREALQGRQRSTNRS